MDAVNRTRYKEDRLKCFEFNARILVQLQIFCTIDLLLYFGISHRNLSISVLIRFTNPNFVWIDFILMLVAKLKRRNKTLLFVPIQIYCCKQTNERTNICKLWPHLFLNCECMCVSSTSNTIFNSIFFSAWFLPWSLCHFSLASFFTSKMHNKSFTGRLKLFVLRARLTKKNTYVFTRNMSLVRARKNVFFWDEKRETNSYSCCVIHENMKCKVLTFPKQCKTTWFQIDRLLRLHFHIWMTIKSHA